MPQILLHKASLCCRLAIVFACVLGSPVTGNSQNQVLDSLKVVLKQLSEEDRKKADVLHQLAFESWDVDFEEGLKHAQRALEISNKLGYRKGIVQSLTDIGQYYYFKGDYTTAKAFYLKALAAGGSWIFENYPAYTLVRIGNLYRVQAKFDSANHYYDRALAVSQNEPASAIAVSSAYYNKGLVSDQLSYYGEAKDYLRQALLLRKKLGDSVLIAETWMMLGKASVGLREYDSAIHYFEKAKRIADGYANRSLQFHYALKKGEMLYYQGKFDTAAKLFTGALDLIKQHEFRAYYPIILKHIALVFQAQGDFNQALEKFFTAMDINEQLGNHFEIAQIKNLLGWLYLSVKNDSIAHAYGAQALKTMQSLNYKVGLASSYNLMGYVHYVRRDYPAALQFFEDAYALRLELNLITEKSSTLMNIAQVQAMQGQYIKAKRTYETALEVDTAAIDQRILAMVYNRYGELLIKTNEYDRALVLLQKGNALAQRAKLPLQLKDNWLQFANLHRARRDFASATEYYEKYILLSDSIYKSESLTKTAQLNAIYQLEKKELEIKKLFQENEVKQSEIALQQSQLRFQRTGLIFSILALGLLSVLVYVLYKYYRSKSKAHTVLSRLNRDISEQSEEIQAQAEELREANETLTALNHQLIETREELQAQSEELIEANAIISNINKDLERKVQHRTEQLQQAYVELDTFFYRSSHDFRRPITTFLGLAEVAKITVKDSNALDLFGKVRETALNLDKMLVKLQSISDVGTQQLVFKEVLLKEIILHVIDGQRSEIDARKVRVLFDYQVKHAFHSYPALVKIIVDNLIENAIHFSGTEDPFLQVSAFGRDDLLVLEVSDNGQGIAPEYHDRIFDMYFRANLSSRGNGLGLYIVKKAVDKLNGVISFQSYLHKGTTFSVEIPFQSGRSEA